MPHRRPGGRTLRCVELQADRFAEIAGRPLPQLNRRDVAIALLKIPSPDALVSLPGLRRAMMAAGNPLSAAFWDSAEQVLTKIKDADATFGDVHAWIEATGTEPAGIIGLHVWDEQAERSPLQEEMHARLVHHLEEQLAAGAIDPDRLVTGDQAARHQYLALQERWMTTPLPDGRVPMTVLLDEQDDEFLADWAEADAHALSTLEQVLNEAGDRPVPQGELSAASSRIREDIAREGWPGELLIALSGETAATLPADDTNLWVSVAASVPSPAGPDLEEAEPAEFDDAFGLTGAESIEEVNGFGAEDEITTALAAVCSLDHYDWLAVLTALIRGGPGTPASAADLARYVRDFDPDEFTPEDEADLDEDDLTAPGEGSYLDDDEFDELGVEGLFLPVTVAWSIIGAIDSDDRLTALGWWGLPEAMRRVWSSLTGRAGRRVTRGELLIGRGQQGPQVLAPDPDPRRLEHPQQQVRRVGRTARQRTQPRLAQPGRPVIGKALG